MPGTNPSTSLHAMFMNLSLAEGVPVLSGFMHHFIRCRADFCSEACVLALVFSVLAVILLALQLTISSQAVPIYLPRRSFASL